MKRRILFCIFVLWMLSVPVSADVIKWVDFGVPYESLKYAMDVDIATAEQEKHISWIDALALAACRTGGRCSPDSVKKAVTELKQDKSPEEVKKYAYRRGTPPAHEGQISK